MFFKIKSKTKYNKQIYTFISSLTNWEYNKEITKIVSVEKHPNSVFEINWATVKHLHRFQSQRFLGVELELFLN